MQAPRLYDPGVCTDVVWRMQKIATKKHSSNWLPVSQLYLQNCRFSSGQVGKRNKIPEKKHYVNLKVEKNEKKH